MNLPPISQKNNPDLENIGKAKVPFFISDGADFVSIYQFVNMSICSVSVMYQLSSWLHHSIHKKLINSKYQEKSFTFLSWISAVPDCAS